MKHLVLYLAVAFCIFCEAGSLGGLFVGGRLKLTSHNLGLNALGKVDGRPRDRRDTESLELEDNPDGGTGSEGVNGVAGHSSANVEAKVGASGLQALGIHGNREMARTGTGSAGFSSKTSGSSGSGSVQTGVHGGISAAMNFKANGADGSSGSRAQVDSDHSSHPALRIQFDASRGFSPNTLGGDVGPSENGEGSKDTSGLQASGDADISGTGVTNPSDSVTSGPDSTAENQ